MIILFKYFLYFIIYSFLGWVMEVCLCIYKEHRFINRGFLIGPICPIYGWGVLFIVLLIDGNKSDLLAVFLKSILICSILEYSTSFLMEKIFKARWWDYSNRKFNINGRICLETMIPFGIMGSAVVLYLHPLLTSIIDKIPLNLMIALSTLLIILFLLDNFVSFNVLSKIKDEIKRHDIDSTEDIRKKVMKWLSDNTMLFRHIMDAFPKFKIIYKMKERIVK